MHTRKERIKGGLKRMKTSLDSSARAQLGLTRLRVPQVAGIPHQRPGHVPTVARRNAGGAPLRRLLLLSHPTIPLLQGGVGPPSRERAPHIASQVPVVGKAQARSSIQAKASLGIKARSKPCEENSRESPAF